MKYQYIVFLILLLGINILPCLPQEQDVEKLLELEAEYSDQSDLIELLSEFEKNPININKTDEQQLSILPWITPYLAKNIITYRKQYGDFQYPEELMNVPGITPDIFKVVEKYLTVEKKDDVKTLELNYRSKMIRKIEKSVGYQKKDYYNSPNKYYNRLKMTFYQKYNLGILFEKDSGEKQFSDLTLFYFKYQDSAQKFKIIFGNYRLELGQGMTFWSPYGSRKGSAPVYPAIKRERGLLNYSMVDENASLFGIASQICFKIYQLILFYSNTKLDALVDSLGNVGSLQTTGYHRTSSEIENKDALEEKLLGSRFVAYCGENIKIGSTFYGSVYDKPIENSDFERKRFDFYGTKNYVVSTDFNIKYNNVHIFSELAQSKNKGSGVVLGTNFNVKPVNILLLFRNYAKNFHSLHGSVFGERGGTPQNEQGFYTGIRYKIFPNTKILFYFDIFKFPWRTYLEEMPISGTDFLFQIEQKLKRKLLLTFRIKRKQKEKSTSLNNRFENEKKINLRLQLEYRPIPNLKLRGRIEKSYYRFEQENKGLLLYQDITYRIKNKLNIYYRLTFFDTDSYNSRLYQFENDLPYVLTNQMLYEKGSRWYVCILYNMFSIMRLSCKYSVTNYEDNVTIGSGNDLVDSDSVHAISFQLESNF